MASLTHKPSFAWAACLLGLLIAGCGPKSVDARRAHAESVSDRAAAKLDEVDRQLQALEPDRAAQLLTQAKDILADRDLDLYPEAEMLRDRLTDAKAKLEICREDREKRDLAILVAARKAEVDRELGKLNTALGALAVKGFGPSQIEAVRQQVKQVRLEIAKGASVAAQDKPYNNYTLDVQHQLDQTLNKASLAEKTLDFNAGPLQARAAGIALVTAAKTERDAAKRAQGYLDAQAKYQTCVDSSAKLFQATQGLEREKEDLDGTVTSLFAISAGCKTKSDALNKPLALAQKQAAKDAKRKPKKTKAR